MSICVERINKSQAGTLHFIFFILVLFGEGHEEISIDILHIEWGKVWGQSRVGKGPRGQRHWTKVSVENVHGASMKIGYIEVVRTSPRPKSKARVDRRARLVDLTNSVGRIDCLIPPGNRAVERDEDKACWLAGRELEIR